METYIWDFNKALGDTIGEKFESLYVFLIQVNQETPIATIMAGPDLISLIQIRQPADQAPAVHCQLNEIEYAGKFGKSFGENKSDSISLLINREMESDEMLIFGPEGTALIKVLNFIF